MTKLSHMSVAEKVFHMSRDFSFEELVYQAFDKVIGVEVERYRLQRMAVDSGSIKEDVLKYRGELKRNTTNFFVRCEPYQQLLGNGVRVQVYGEALNASSKNLSELEIVLSWEGYHAGLACEAIRHFGTDDTAVLTLSNQQGSCSVKLKKRWFGRQWQRVEGFPHRFCTDSWKDYVHDWLGKLGIVYAERKVQSSEYVTVPKMSEAYAWASIREQKVMVDSMSEKTRVRTEYDGQRQQVRLIFKGKKTGLAPEVGKEVKSFIENNIDFLGNRLWIVEHHTNV